MKGFGFRSVRAFGFVSVGLVTLNPKPLCWSFLVSGRGVDLSAFAVEAASCLGFRVWGTLHKPYSVSPSLRIAEITEIHRALNPKPKTLNPKP